MQSPTVLRRRLGASLRKLRSDQNIAAKDVCAPLGWSLSKLSRIESGEIALRDAEVRPLLEIYGVTADDEVRSIRDLARRSRQRGWWQSYGDSVPGWFADYVGFEADAARIRTFQQELIPGLFQTQDYARAVFQVGHPLETSDQIDQRVALRMERQAILDRPEGPQIWAVMSEAVARRPVGSPAIMAAQLLKLADLSRSSKVVVQFLPFTAGAHASMGQSFVLFEFTDEVPGTVAYTEAMTGALYMDRPSDLDRHEDAFSRLMASADPPERTRDWLHQLAKEYAP